MASSSRAPHLLHLDKQGRLIIPADLRRALGVEPDSDLTAVLADGTLVLKPKQATERDLWAMFAAVNDSLSDELMADRRTEATRER